MKHLKVTRQSRPRVGSAGVTLCHAYAGSWRAKAPPLDLPIVELVTILPQLIGFGGAGLVWPRLRDCPENAEVVALALRRSYRQQAKANRGAPAQVAQAVRALREFGIDPVLIKGWAVARQYPPGIERLSGDIDLVVRPEEACRASDALASASLAGLTTDVDLQHDRCWAELPRSDFRDFTERIDIDGTQVRVLCPELQLHVLAHHFMRHACLRPLWLCDVALMLESRPASFDWELCLGEDRRRRDWVTTAICLAHTLLGARIDDTPFADKSERLPGWLAPAVLRRWELGEFTSQSVMSEIGTRGVLTRLSRHRWPDPVGATVFLRAPFNSFPRLPLQWTAFIYRALTYGVPEMLRDKIDRLRGTPARGAARQA